MSDPTRDERARQVAPPTAVAPVRPPIELQQKPRASQALQWIRHILQEGRRDNFKVLPEIATSLSDDDKKEFLATVSTNLSAVPGDIALDIAEAVRADVSTAVTLAFANSAEKVSALKLRRYLSSMKSSVLAKLRGDLVEGVKDRLEQQPLLLALPDVSRNLREFAKHLEFLRWLIESAPPAVVAGRVSIVV